jgi:hypothetical protein
MKYLLVLILTILTGCAGLTPAKSLEDRIAYAYGSLTVAANTASYAYSSGKISKETVLKIVPVLKEAGEYLDTAYDLLVKGDSVQSEQVLLKALQLLEKVELMMQSKVEAKYSSDLTTLFCKELYSYDC